MPRSPLPNPLGLGPFSFTEARNAGVARSRLRAPGIAHPHHGLYTVEGHDDLLSRCRALLPLLGEDHWFSHLTAARIWNIPLPFAWTPAEPLHVTALADRPPVRRSGIVGWETADAAVEREMISGIPVLAPAITWTQLAVPGATGVDPDTREKRALSPQWLVAAGDFLLTGPRWPKPRRGLCDAAALASASRAHRGKRGAKSLSWALEHLRHPVDSPRESLLRLLLVSYALPEPDTQVPVMTAEGVLHADLGYPHARVLIEYHGDHHRTDPRQWREDLRRRQLFEEAGYVVIEVTLADFADGGAALAARVRRALRRAAQ